MSWNVNQLFTYVQFLVNKSQTGDLSPDNFFYAFNSEQRAYMSDLLGRWEKNNNGKSGLNTGLIENETILSSLSPFTKKVTLAPSVAGAITKPTDLVYRLAMRANNHNVRFVNKGQIYSVINSAIDAPSITSNIYFYTEYDTIYTIWPTATPSIDLDYIRDCRDVLWAFIPDANGVPVYNEGGSIQPEWAMADLVTIVKRSIKSMGLHFASPNMENFGNSAINTGN